jgi:anti-sigma B factor antagonist
MRCHIGRGCGTPNASTSAERLRHDSGSCGQTGNAMRNAMTQVATTSDSNLEISVDQIGKDTLVLLRGRINVDSSPDLRDQLLAILCKVPLPRTVTVDLAGVSYVETSGIATLIEALRIAHHHQIGFCLQGLGGSVLRLFEVTSVLTLFDTAGRGEKVS